MGGEIWIIKTTAGFIFYKNCRLKLEFHPLQVLTRTSLTSTAFGGHDTVTTRISRRMSQPSVHVSLSLSLAWHVLGTAGSGG